MRYKITTLKNAIPYCYTLWANSQEEALYKAQQKDGIPPLLVEEFPLFSLSSNSSIFSIFSPPPSSKDVLTSLKQLHLMLSANLPIQQCIVSLARHTPNQKLAQIFSHLSHSLENGLSLYEGFLPYEKIFGKLTLVMIKFGSKSGRLCKCLALLLDELNDQENNKKEIKKALFYPSFILICTISCFAVLLQMVVPQFIELFAQNNLSLPIYTKILLLLQEWVSKYWTFALFFLVMTCGFLIFQMRQKGILYQPILSLCLKLPLIGKIFLNSYLHQYFFTLSILLQSGFDLLTSASLAQESISSQAIQNKLNLIQNALINGKTFCDGLKESALFDSLTLSLILVAQGSGKLDEILHTCATHYQSKNKDLLAFLISLIEPVFTLLLGIFVLFLALGIFTPIWNL